MPVHKISYGGWPNCYLLTNGELEAIATTDVGPRIIRLGFRGEENIFREFHDQLGKTGGDEWRIYGGHRLWHAPEHPVRTYFPDNGPVKVEELDGGIKLTQEVEATTGIQKEMELYMDSGENRIKVVHRIWNKNLWAIELAPWAISVMAQGGMAIVPQEPFAPHPQALLPARPMALWPYTDMSDPRWRWGAKYVTLKQDPNAKTSQKAGFGNTMGWVAYYRNGFLFVKRFEYKEGSSYPDFGSTVELFTNSEILEVETLGPLSEIKPGGFVEHVEYWSLYKDVELEDTDESIEDNLALLPY
jgi:hypothetical protein